MAGQKVSERSRATAGRLSFSMSLFLLRTRGWGPETTDCAGRVLAWRSPGVKVGVKSRVKSAIVIPLQEGEMTRLSMTLLGGFSARLEPGGALSLPTRKAQALLAYLALPLGRAHRRDKLAS